MQFYTNDTHRMVISASGEVGIGTTAPAYQLQVRGPAGLDGNIVADTTDTSGGSSDAKLGLAKGGTVKWFLMNDGSQSDKFYIQDEGGAQAITVQQDGKVGIGVGATDVVAGNFQCVGNGYFTSGTGDTNGVFIGTGSSVGMISSNTAVDLLFGINGNEKMRLKADGKVGIGTSSPLAPLHVSHSIRLSDNETDDTNKSSYIIASQYDSGTETEGFIAMRTYAPTGVNAVRLGGGHSSWNTATEITFYSAANETTREGTERMRIDSAGNVGIGITSPAFILDCKSSAVVAKFYRTSSGTGTNASAHFASDVGGTDTIVCTIRNDGDLENTNNSYGALSDRNVKSYISDSRGYLADINKLKVKKFKFNSHIVQENAGTGSAEWRLGLIAQDVEEVFPGLVTSGSYEGAQIMYSGSAENDTITKVTGSEAITKSVKHSIVNTMLIKAVQELTDEVKFLRASITGSSDINQLKALVSGSTFV